MNNSANAHPTSDLLDLTELPNYQVQFTHPRTSKYAICIPVINEGEKILKQLQGMSAANFGLDIIIIDGGSTDGSMEPQRLQEKFTVNTLLVKTGPGKLSAQLRIAMAWAMAQGYEGIITIDGNGKDDYMAIPSFSEKLSAGYDHIQGSRYIPGGIAENTPFDRAMGVRLIHAPVISLGAGFKYTDTTNGFRGYSRNFLLNPAVRPFRNIFQTYNLHYYLAIRAPRLGFKVCEIPVTRKYPATGPIPSKINSLNGKLHILKQMFLAACGAYNP